MSISFLRFVLLSLLASSSSAATITQASQLKSKTFDYIIVGAGNAGLVVANRLTEDLNVSVLVLEAGVSDQGVIPVQVPFLGPTLTPHTQWDWNYTITPQPGMNGRTFPYPRGKLLGGSSSVNYLFHQFGTDEDWNRLASVSGDQGWTWANMKKYVQKHERFSPPIDGHNTTGQFIPSLHGFNGEVSVSLPGFNQSIDSLVVKATTELPEFPFNEDTSGGDHSLLGIGFVQSSAGNGSRSSSSTSYLANANKRPNLTVLINATVLKLLQTGSGPSGKAFRSVQFQSTPGTSSSNGGASAVTVTARKEVILSAGSVGTPQILQLSGIGNADDLKKLKIQSTLNNPNVGENLSDHTLLSNVFSVQDNGQSFDHILRDSSLVQEVMNQWTQNKTGIFANNVANNFGFARVPSNATIFKTVRDPAAGPKSPHWELVFANNFFVPGQSTPPTGSFMSIVVVLISPTSRGSIKIQSSNPLEQPLINPNYLSTDWDIFVMRNAVDSIKLLAGSPAFSNYVIGPFGSSFQNATTDAATDSYIRGLSSTIFHPVGTASMTTSESNNGVVGPDLKVKGADGLRIVDASVFPFIPSCHTQGPVYLLAERASDIIKQEDNL